MNFGYRFTVVVLVFTLTQLSLAERGRRDAGPPGGGVTHIGTEREPIPEFKRVDSAYPSALSSIDGIAVTEDYTSRFPWILTGKDTTVREVEFGEKYLRGEGPEFSYRLEPTKPGDVVEDFVYVNRYSIGDPKGEGGLKVSEFLRRAKEQGITVKAITDWTGTANVPHERFEEEEGGIGRFKALDTLRPEDFLDNQKGRFLAAMLRNGAKYGDEKFGIVGIMYEKRSGVENPLMHMKCMLIGRRVNGKVTHLFGTDGSGNWSRYEQQGEAPRATRINRMYIEKDPVYLLHNLEHFEGLYRAYQQGGQTRDIEREASPPQEIHYGNGDIRRVMYTDGRYNPYDMLAVTLAQSFIEDQEAIERLRRRNPRFGILLDRMIASGEISTKNARIDKFKAKWLLLTNRTVFEALVEALAHNPKLVVDIKVDQEGARVENQGLIAPLLGIPSLREFGGNVRGVSPDIANRVRLHVYQRLIEGMKDNDRSTSWMSHNLLHNKSSMVWITEPGGKQRVHVFDKSFNPSEHVDNAEELNQFILDPRDEMVQGLEESIDKPFEIELKKGFYVEGYEAFFRDALGRLTAHAHDDVPLEEVRAIREAYRARDLGKVERMLSELIDRRSSLDNYAQLTPEKRKARIQRILNLLRWQQARDSASWTNNALRTLDQRFILFCSLIANQDPLDQWEQTENFRHPFQIWEAVQDMVASVRGERLSRFGRAPRVISPEARDVWKKVLGFGEIPLPPPTDELGRLQYKTDKPVPPVGAGPAPVYTAENRKDGGPRPEPMTDTYYDGNRVDAAKNDRPLRVRRSERDRSGAWNVGPGRSAKGCIDPLAGLGRGRGGRRG